MREEDSGLACTSESLRCDCESWESIIQLTFYPEICPFESGPKLVIDGRPCAFSFSSLAMRIIRPFYATIGTNILFDRRLEGIFIAMNSAMKWI